MKTREELIEMHKPQGVWYDNPNFSLEELQQILSAPTKAQMECKLCHPHIDLPVVTTGLVNEFYCERNKDIGLKYCPHSGRKLGDD